MRFGLVLANRDVSLGTATADQLLEQAVRAEESGLFDSVWAGDSLLAQPRLDALTLLAAVAARTRRVLLGTACMGSFPLWHPIQLAYQWASLDHLAHGRLIMVACTGGRRGNLEAEGAAFGVPASRRRKRLEEQFEILRRLWTEERVDHDGEFFRFRDVTVLPRPVQPLPPLWIASNPAALDPEGVRRSLAWVARLADGWMTHSVSPAVFAARWQTIVEHATRLGRDVSRFGSCFYHNITIDPDRERALSEAKRYLDRYYGTDIRPEQVGAWSALGSVDACVEQLRRFRDAGVARVALRLCSRDQDAQLEAVIDHVLPRLAE